ncbi:HNH endonuclease signature motif containing protein [Paenibacillus glycanilyticus]|uniref:HNH endonuclease signature motif containing protein n=1 Tax=Paenibacillus glycanilyticus TaxID=126569 RepID=UPI000FD78520|nr:HNH endonuclease signature motif containing protein [Paenibacillus glycanilyticus]
MTNRQGKHLNIKNKYWTLVNEGNIIARKLVTKSDFRGVIRLSQELSNYFEDYIKVSNTKNDLSSLQFSGVIEYDFAYFDGDKLSFHPLRSDPYYSCLRDILSEQYDYFFNSNGQPRRSNKRDILPDDLKVYLELRCEDEWKTLDGDLRRSFIFDIYKPIPQIEEETTVEIMKIFGDNESLLEGIINSNIDVEEDTYFDRFLEDKDETAKIIIKEAIIKTRRYKKSIINNLKKQYEGKCQICQYTSYPEHQIDIVEAHHIDLFSKTIDNSPSNIVILCPNHHRLIHAGKFVFDRENLSFISSSTSLEISINKHL